MSEPEKIIWCAWTLSILSPKNIEPGCWMKGERSLQKIVLHCRKTHWMAFYLHLGWKWARWRWDILLSQWTRITNFIATPSNRPESEYRLSSIKMNATSSIEFLGRIQSITWSICHAGFWISVSSQIITLKLKSMVHPTVITTLHHYPIRHAFWHLDITTRTIDINLNDVTIHWKFRTVFR